MHPDKNGGNEKAEEAFKRLQNAYEVSCIHLVAFESWVFWQLKKQGTFCVWQIYSILPRLFSFWINLVSICTFVESGVAGWSQKEVL